MSHFSDWIPWALPFAIALFILWDGRRKPSTLSMAIFWTVAEIQGAFDFQAGFHWRAIIGVTAVTVACLPGLLRLMRAPLPRGSSISGTATADGIDANSDLTPLKQ